MRALEMGPPRLVSALTGTGGSVHAYSDRLDDLRFERTGLTVFPTLQPGDATYFGFERTLKDAIVRFEIGATADGVGVRPEDPPVIWGVLQRVGSPRCCWTARAASTAAARSVADR
jgi:hypothetical protein